MRQSCCADLSRYVHLFSHRILPARPSFPPCGVLTFGLRYLGVGIYSAVYATLAVQIFSRLLDSLFIPKCFGNTVGARLFHTEAEKQSD